MRPRRSAEALPDEPFAKLPTALGLPPKPRNAQALCSGPAAEAARLTALARFGFGRACPRAAALYARLPAAWALFSSRRWTRHGSREPR